MMITAVTIRARVRQARRQAAKAATVFARICREGDAANLYNALMSSGVVGPARRFRDLVNAFVADMGPAQQPELDLRAVIEAGRHLRRSGT